MEAETLVQNSNPIAYANAQGYKVVYENDIGFNTVKIYLSTTHIVMWHHYFENPMYDDDRILAEYIMDGDLARVKRFARMNMSRYTDVDLDDSVTLEYAATIKRADMSVAGRWANAEKSWEAICDAVAYDDADVDDYDD